MPLRALRPEGDPVLSIDCTAEQWEAVKQDVKDRHPLWRLPCCDAQVIAKTSQGGLRFFAHKARNSCTWTAETIHHIRLKQVAIEVARHLGYQANTEVSGETPESEKWVADVLAVRGKAKVAIEVQWSAQTNEELIERQRRYQRAGIKGFWLIRATGFPLQEDLPAVCVRETVSSGHYQALVPISHGERRRNPDIDYDWAYRLPIEDLLKYALGSQMRWGVRKGEPLTFQVFAATTTCWKCRRKTSPITNIGVTVSSTPIDLPLEAFGKSPELLRELVPDRVRHEHRIGVLRTRPSKTEGASYMSNGCYECDVLQGRHFKHEYANYEHVRYEGTGTVDERWKHVLDPWMKHYWRILGMKPISRFPGMYDDEEAESDFQEMPLD